MSGYEIKNRNSSLNTMANRFGNYNEIPIIKEEDSETQKPLSYYDIDGIKNLKTRLTSGGGFAQQDRMILDKRRSLDKALLYSYQSAKIKKIQCSDDNDNSNFFNIKNIEEHDICRALINPDKTKMDYDDKIISVHYEENYHPGDVFEWIGTNSYWMIYLQDLTETAYFRGEIRRCSYEIDWEDDEGIQSTYAAVRGPVETKIDYIQKHGISVDNPNYSLDIYIPKTEKTLNFFRRYAKFYLKDEPQGSPDVCWRVEAVDWISTPGILEVLAVEYYINETEDDLDNRIANCVIIDSKNETTKKLANIEGETFIKPKKVYKYVYTGVDIGDWEVSENCPARIKLNNSNPLEVFVKWDSASSGQFDLFFGEEKKTIVVESLF